MSKFTKLIVVCFSIAFGPQLFAASNFALSGPLVPGSGPEALEIHLENYKRKPALAYLPDQYSDSKSWPLVILLHGFTGTAKSQDRYLKLSERVSKRGFIALVPEGTETPAGTIGEDGRDLGGNQFWNAIDTCCDFGRTGVDDVGYLLTLIKHVKQKYKIDDTQVFVMGHSNGGFMANRLACESGETFAAIANLAGGTYKDPAKCNKPSAVRYLQIHAENDETILYNEAPYWAGGRPTVDQWLNKNGCSAEAGRADAKDYVWLIRGADTEPTVWKNCSSQKEVQLWTIRSYEHRLHNPHIPFFHASFMDAVLDFFFKGE